MTKTDTALRDRVQQTAPTTTKEALRLARDIRDPWYRCQALAFVAASAADGKQRERLLKEAFDLAYSLPDLNRAVSASAWPLKVLAKTGQASAVASETTKIVELANREPSPVRRADALNLVLGASLVGPRAQFFRVFECFKSTCLQKLSDGKRNTKGESLLMTWIAIVDRLDDSVTADLVASLSTAESRARAQAQLSRTRDLKISDLCTWPNIAVD